MARQSCAACGQPVTHQALVLEQADERTPLCSFECLINYAVTRIRERREHHNEQLAALRDHKKR
jgi:hypothetical protein